jgi:hypothetical protein
VKIIEFEANRPANNSDFEKLKRTMKSFNGVREKVVSAYESLPLSHEAQEEIANEFESDRFAVEDVITVVLEQASPVFPEYRAKGFWTFGRQSPRFGTPWGTLLFDDIHKTIELMIRYGGSFEDDEDTPLWLRCPILSTGGASYDELCALAANCKALDIWWYLEDGKVSGKLVFQ